MKRLALLFLLFAVPAQAWTRKPLFQVVPFGGGSGSGGTPTFPLLAPNGSASAPSYSFASAPGAGMYFFSGAGGYTVLQGEDATGTDVAGKHITINSGRGTGTGAGGAFYVSIAPPAASTGAALNTSQNVINFNDTNSLVGSISTHTLGGTNVYTAYSRPAGDTDAAGNAVFLRGGLGTGTGAGGNLNLEVSLPAAGTGSTQNGQQTVVAISGLTGDVTVLPGLPGGGTRGSISLSGGGAAGTGLKLERTITAAGTTGARTIDKMAGTVNFAAAATAIVVTDALVNTSSIVFSTIRTADTTCTFVKSVVPAAGSFTITLNAGCNAETSVGFWVTN